ncbi:histidine kinase [Streptomyces sp. NBC_01387]|uniref:sensor histidine kinase n=2 Tax=Streptomyces TaxID=1883 RepID=UPI0022503668|nr:MULTISPECIES: histidine kinase [unclassified Streptomyces]MCX4550972.1 histidine kinase [Streptomyces sp. NBC_01500]
MMSKQRWTGPVDRAMLDRHSLIGATTLVICMAISVVAAHGTTLKIVVAVLGVLAELGMVLGRRVLPSPLGALGATLAIATGLAITLLAPSGLGSVPVLAGTSVLPLRLPAGPVRHAGVGVVSVAFGISILVVTGSPAGLLAGVGAWFMADRSVEHAALQAERDRAVALLAEVEASRQALQEAAAVEERSRIAREMHDVLAHSLAGLSVQLQAVRAIANREGSPAVLTGPLDRAAELAREGVQEARAAVGALRVAPLRGVDDLKGLVGGFPGEAHLWTTGRARPLRPEAGHAVYRGVQEAMTNAARYATGSPIEVEVAWAERELRVAVRDQGLPPGRALSGVKGSGTGLASMAERIEAVGGSLSAGPAPGGTGWQIEMRVPV